MKEEEFYKICNVLIKLIIVGAILLIIVCYIHFSGNINAYSYNKEVMNQFCIDKGYEEMTDYERLHEYCNSADKKLGIECDNKKIYTVSYKTFCGNADKFGKCPTSCSHHMKDLMEI